MLRFLRKTKGLEWLAAILLFLMLREWLLPLTALTDTGELSTFYYIAAGVLIVDMLLSWRWLTLLIKMFGVLYLLNARFFDMPLLDMEWLTELYGKLLHDFPLLLQQNWMEMSDVGRNALFYFMLVVLISLVSYLVIEQRQGLWFVFITEAYLATLDTFLPYEADNAVIRTLVVGFLLLAVLHLQAMAKLTPKTGSSKFSLIRSLVAPLLIISLTVGIAYGAPKAGPSWPDPISYITGNQAGGTYYMKKVGYDNNDSKLGGPFIQDDSLVFLAKTNEETYWRGDSKDVYTGEGWQKGITKYEAILDPDQYTWNNTLFQNLEKKEVHAALDFRGGEQFSTIFYPGQMTKLTHFTPHNATIMYDSDNVQLEVRDGKVQLYQAQNTTESSSKRTVTSPNTLLMKLNNYQLTSEVPILSEKKMVNAGNAYSPAIKETYLQLPKNLPPRIKQLAEKVTANAKTPYEQVRAIENYLRSSGQYKYETKDVPVPAKGQDFVDQFLFESHRGYCDHFSSSMAVMLRSIGIPARWVKGFAPGTNTGDDGNGNQLIEVRNKDAHSWVEVYFPDYGWIPFEATSTFISPIRVNHDLFQETAQQPLPVPNLGEQNPIDRGDGRLDGLEDPGATSGKKFTVPWQTYPIAVVVIGAAGVFLWKRRRQLIFWWLHRQMTIHQEDHFVEKYQVLLRMIEKSMSERREGETLREYINRLRLSGDKRQDLWYLTQLFERVHYGYKDIGDKAKGIANKLMEQLSQQLKP